MRPLVPESRGDPVVNELPDRPSGDRPPSRDRPPAASAESSWSSAEPGRGRAPEHRARLLEEMEGEGEEFSGNGMTELETRHGALLGTHPSLGGQQEQTRRGGGPEPGPESGPELSLELQEEEDIFLAQGYLPLSSQTLRPEVPTTTTTTTTTSAATQTTGAPRGAGAPVQALLLSRLDFEGSGSLAPSSNQTL